jgi:pimeloyl-ACP methyl ester carboxylesterase
VIETLETRYAKTGDGVHIAYQVAGDGPPDVVYANSYMSHIEVSWEYPPAARFYEQMARFGRLVLFDRRGTGLSDPIVASFSLEDRVNDLLAVLDAVGLERAVLLGSSEGAAAAAYFAALHPQRVSALVLYAPLMVAVADDECPWAWTRDTWELFFAGLDEAWASGGGIELTNPSLADDPEALAWYARYFRLSASPALVRALMHYNLDVDIRPILPSIQAPTLLLHRRDETWLSVEQSRYAASKIPEAQLVELEGTDHYIWEQNADLVVEEIEEFLTGVRSSRATLRSLKTLMFTDIVKSTDRAVELGDDQWRRLLDRQDSAVNRQIDRFDGQFIKSTGDGVLATFDSPARAIRCALAIREAMRGLGIEIRAGVHTGEVDHRGNDLGGVAVHIASRVADTAEAGEVLVSRTVADLVAGSDVKLADRGEHTLKGIPDPWRLILRTRCSALAR